MFKVGFLIFLCICLCESDDYFIGTARQQIEALRSKNETSSDGEKTQRCLKDLFQYIDDLDKRQSWAIYMKDSGASYLKPGELLPGFWGSGRLADLGNDYPKCLDLTHEQITGSYCIIEMNVEKVLEGLSPEEKQREHVAENELFFKQSGCPPFHRFYQMSLPIRLRLGACLPDSCTPEILNDLNILPENTEVAHCHTKKQMEEYRSLNTFDWSFIIFMATILFLVTISTLRDVYSVPKKDALGAFSLVANGKELLDFSGKSKNFIGSLEGLRAGAVTIVISYHLLYAAYMGPINNNRHLFTSLIEGWKIIANQAHVTVDTFYLMGGLVMVYSFMNTHHKTSGAYFSPVRHVIRRYLRLTPVIAVILWHQLTLVRNTYMPGDPVGPLWHEDPKGGGALAYLCGDCRKYYWTTLLYIQNWVNPYNLCLDHLWYTSTDMQLTLISPIILLFLARRSSHGTKIKVLWAMIISTCLYSFLYHWYYGYNTLMLWSACQENYAVFYTSTLTKCPSWFIGLLFGYVLYNAPNNHVINQWLSVPSNRKILWICSAIAASFCLYGSAYLPDPQKQYHTGMSAILHALYSISFRSIWAFMVGINIYTLQIIVPEGGFNKYMSNPIFQFISKISFTLYVCHMSVVTVRLANAVDTQFHTFPMIAEAIGLLPIHGLVATFLTLTIELPFSKLQKYLVSADRVPKDVSTDSNSNDISQMKNGKAH